MTTATVTTASSAYAAYVSRFDPGFQDVIVHEPNQHGKGWPGYSTEFAFHSTTFRSHMTLVEFARQHFGRGRLIPLRNGRVRQVAPAPIQSQERFAVGPLRSGKAPVFPAYVYRI